VDFDFVVTKQSIIQLSPTSNNSIILGGDEEQNTTEYMQEIRGNETQ